MHINCYAAGDIVSRKTTTDVGRLNGRSGGIAVDYNCYFNSEALQKQGDTVDAPAVAVGVNANDSALLKNVSGKTKAELGSDAFAQLLNDNAARMADAVAEVNAYLETLQERGFVHKNDYTGNDLLTWRAQDGVVGFFAEPAPELPFDDVAAGSWYYDDVANVFAKGIMVGTGGGHFSPAVATTRGVVVTMLYEYARYKGYDVTKAADLSGFVDQGSVSDFAVGPMQWAVAQELIFGVGGNAIAPSWLQCCTVFAKCSPEPGTYICSRHGGASIRMRPPRFAPCAGKPAFSRRIFQC